ncbi:RDD family protein [Niallia taxi]|nr:RDD family protein [Niallia taxi]WOD64052.1 RDD family protein [Niallia taxi]
MSMDITNTGVDSLHQHSDEPPKAFDFNHYAGFWMRFWAYLVDIIIITSINRIIIYPVFRLFDLPTENTGLFSMINILTALVFYLYFVLMTKYFKQTLGKMIFGLKVIPLKNEVLTWDTVIFREWIGRFISASIWILYAVVAFQPKKQGLHDLFADTAVVHEKRRR